MKSLMLAIFVCFSCTSLAHRPNDRPSDRPSRGERDHAHDSGRGGRHARGPDSRGPGPGGPWHRPPPNPLVEALDTDGDHVISSSELEDATASLKKLDQDGDGQLTHEEMRPPRAPHGGPDHRSPHRGPGHHGPPHRDGVGHGSHQHDHRPPTCADPKQMDPEEMMLNAMEFDKDEDEKLSKEELRNFLKDFTNSAR